MKYYIIGKELDKAVRTGLIKIIPLGEMWTGEYEDEYALEGPIYRPVKGIQMRGVRGTGSLVFPPDMSWAGCFETKELGLQAEKACKEAGIAGEWL